MKFWVEYESQLSNCVIDSHSPEKRRRYEAFYSGGGEGRGQCNGWENNGGKKAEMTPLKKFRKPKKNKEEACCGVE